MAECVVNLPKGIDHHIVKAPRRIGIRARWKMLVKSKDLAGKVCIRYANIQSADIEAAFTDLDSAIMFQLMEGE